MTGPADAADGSGGSYLAALDDLQRARSEVARHARAVTSERADRRAELDRLDGELADQQDRLRLLADDVRAPLRSPPGPLPDPPALPWDDARDDAVRRIADADAALAHARRVAALPQLLPGWTSGPARAGAVYLALFVPELLVEIALAVAGTGGGTSARVWAFVVWPLVTMIVGGAVIGRVGLPRLRPDEAAPGARPPRRYPWLGVLIAWVGWLVAGWFLPS